MTQMTTTRSDPASLAQSATNSVNWLRREIDHLLEDFGGSSRGIFDFGSRALGLTPTPAIELKEGDQDYQLTAELPGMVEDGVTVKITDGLLTISGEKKETDERKDDGYIVRERRYGSFERRVAIPADVDPDGIKAKFASGVLTVILPKDGKTPARSRKITIEG
jgi:HSP20 family protein